MPRASRSTSTWSSTIPARGTSVAAPTPSAAWTTASTTCSDRGERISTFPAAAKRSTAITPWSATCLSTVYASGSPNLYEASGRLPLHSVNFITCHDGFTLWDLVSYNHKHNDANGEQNRDGANDNNSWNCGLEGPTDDPGVLGLRRRQVRNLLAT